METFQELQWSYILKEHEKEHKSICIQVLSELAVWRVLCYIVIVERKVMCIVSRWPSLGDWTGFPAPQLA